jgi:hypothetical protein
MIPLLALAATPVSPSAVLESPTRHVRTTFPYAQALLRDGFQRSPTFARLLVRLERSDLIVYIESQAALPPGIEGRLLMLSSAHGLRYVLIQIGTGDSQQDAIALLGHELEHANEIADAPGVSDMNGFVALYERIGIRSGSHQYETKMAQEAGRQIRRELA